MINFPHSDMLGFRGTVKLVRINFDTGRVLVKRHRVNLRQFDNNNGVDVEVRFGDTVGVETIQMEMVNPLVYRYHRPV